MAVHDASPSSFCFCWTIPSSLPFGNPDCRENERIANAITSNTATTHIVEIFRLFFLIDTANVGTIRSLLTSNETNSPTRGQHNILNAVRLFEKRSNLLVRKSCDATTDARHKERQFRMLLGEGNELVHIRTDGINPTLHRRDAVALPLQSYALSHDGAKLAVGDISRPTAVHSLQVAAEYEYLVGLQLRNKLWCRAFLFHKVLFNKVESPF